jgi:adenine-specific DNA-methyltransferase
MILNYLGSKARFMPILNRVIEPIIQNAYELKGGPIVFGDLFAGTGFISNYYKTNPCIDTLVSTDLELYSYVLNSALLKTVCSDKMLKIIAMFNSDHLRPVKGLIWKHFSPAGGRMFYTEENAMRIDAIRICISRMHKLGKINYKESLFLLGSLLCACSRSANSTACFRAYLKVFCPRSLKRLEILPVHKSNIRIRKKVATHKDDSINIAGKFNYDVVYLDPPYNANHYGSYYSFYNYLMVYQESYKISGVAGVTSTYNKSDFGFKVTAKATLIKLIENLKTCGTIIMSYNSDGALKKEDIFDSLKLHGDVTLYKTLNKKFKTNDLVKKTTVIEYIFVRVLSKTQLISEYWISNT